MVSRQRMRGPVLALGVLCTVFFGLGWLLSQPGAPVRAQSPTATPAPPPAPPLPNSDYNNRAVAYINGNMVTREELGEYLIARYGADKVELLVNKKIIEEACRQRGIEVQAAEVEADIDETIGTLSGVNREKFVKQILKARNMSLYEWREDVVRPKLLLTKLCRDQVKIEEADLQKAFEARYGEKVKARVIIYPPGSEHLLTEMYDKLRNNPQEFDHAAATQSNGNLARVGGEIAPIGRHTGQGDAMRKLEEVAFRMRPGEVSEQIVTPEGIVIMKCDGRKAADTTKSLEKEREALTKEVMDMKVAELIPKKFKELHDAANVQLILQHPKTEVELKADAKDALSDKKPEKNTAPPATMKQNGN